MTFWLATWGLFVAWLLHDIEELVTMPHWVRRHEQRLRRRFPRVPARAWNMIDFSRAQVYLAVGLVGVVVLAAAWDGARTSGGSAFYQLVLAGFGFHALIHLGESAVMRGYTPGVLTAPVIVAPFSLWAWWVLDHRSVGNRVAGGGIVLALVLIPLVIGGSHGVARVILAVAGRLRRGDRR